MFFDGRNDLYGQPIVSEYLTFMEAKPGWREVAEKYAFTAALVPAKSALSAALGSAKGWRLSYKDAEALIFTRAN